ncbi:MAG TPA: aldo/keto reductase [Caldilineaceae bacterium]|nr:aldo/keto reductase [Caldilineaceae bacterium]
MKLTAIPQTDLTPSAICLGTSNFGAAIPQADAFTLLDAFVDQGGTFLDTAEVYANWRPDLPRSISERTLGTWMAARGNRDRMIIGTKGGHPDLATMHISRLSPAEILYDLRSSLDRLQTDYIDLYWLHRDDPNRPVEEMVETLAAQVQAGTIRAFGCSNWSTDRMRAAWRYATDHAIPGFVANQPLWSLAQPNPAAFGMPGLAGMDEEMYAFHQEVGWAVIPYTSQARGIFSKLAAGGEASLREGERKSYLNEVNRQRLVRVKEIAVQHNATVAQVVLAYLLWQSIPTIPVIGCRTAEQLVESLGALAVELTVEEVIALQH